jgi:hypothetical protein
MGEKLSDKEIIKTEDIVVTQMIQIDALVQLLIRKGVFTEQEFYAKLKQVQIEYEGKKS